MQKEIREMIEELERCEMITASIDEADEDAWMKAYSNEHKAFMKLQKELMDVTGYDRGTANAMIIKYRDELKKLVA